MTDKNDPLYKVRQFLAQVYLTFRTYYGFSNLLCLDECMIKFDGRLYFKQYIKSKPIKWGIKGFLICNSENAYCYKIQIYCVKVTEKVEETLSRSENIVLTFLETIQVENMTLFIDNYYMGPGLLLHLRKKGVRCIGTIKKNRVHSDKKLLDKLEKNQIKFYSNSPDNSLLFIPWEDRNTVRMMTNMYLTKTTTSKVTSGDKVTTQTKPDAALEYNKYAKGVDRCNQLSTEYSYPHRSKKWWKPIFYHILQVCITNALIIFKEITKQKITHKEFIESIIVNLLGEPKNKRSKLKTNFICLHILIQKTKLKVAVKWKIVLENLFGSAQLVLLETKMCISAFLNVGGNFTRVYNWS